MTTPDNGEVVPARHSLDHETMAAISPLPPPVEVFLDWLVSVPHGADLEASARKQIALIDRRMPRHPEAQVLRIMLAAVASPGGWPKPVSNV